MSTPRHFLTLEDFTEDQLRGMLAMATELKARTKRGERSELLPHKMLAMIFEKQSTRTRVSFDVGMRQLGGDTMFLSGDSMQLAREETLADTARVMSRYVDAIMIRILDHDDLLDLAGASDIPVINGLTRRAHQLSRVGAEQHVAPRRDAPEARGEHLRLALVVLDLELDAIPRESLPYAQPMRGLPAESPVPARQRQAGAHPQRAHRIATSYRN